MNKSEAYSSLKFIYVPSQAEMLDISSPQVAPSQAHYI